MDYGVFKQFYDQNGKCLKNLFLIIIITFSEEEKLFSCLRKKSFAYMFFFRFVWTSNIIVDILNKNAFLK